MIVRGEGGTGKTVLLNAITHTFDYLEALTLLAKTATTGVAASLVGGQTVHSWAGIPIRAADNPNWMEKSGEATVKKRKKNILPAKYLDVDKCSMLTKQLLTQLSQIVGRCGSSIHADYRTPAGHQYHNAPGLQSNPEHLPRINIEHPN